MKSGNPLAFSKSTDKRRGAVAPFLALMSVPLFGAIAFSIDYGYLKNVETELQRAADASALAAVLELIPDLDGTQHASNVRATVKAYVQQNLAASMAGDNTFTVLDEDIQIGSYDETTINGTAPVTLNYSGVWDTVRVTLRRDSNANGSVNLFFARVLGIDTKPVTATATAVLRRAQGLRSGADVLPFAIPVSFWDSLNGGEELSIYNDNTITDDYGNQVTVQDANGNAVPANWGTVDVGWENNSTHDLDNQILNGLVDADVQALYQQERIPTPDEIPLPVDFQAEPGISVGIRNDVEAIHGQTRIIPLYSHITGNLSAAATAGNIAEFHIVAWGVLQVVNSSWQGNHQTYITARKGYTYDGALVPQQNLSSKNTSMKNIFTSPVLVR